MSPEPPASPESEDAESRTSGRPGGDRLPTTRVSARLESWVTGLGDLASWIWLALVGVIVVNVVLRYLFSSGRIELEELQWHLYAIGFLCGLSYCMPTDNHVRVDVLRDRMTPRMRAWIELYGLLLLVIPLTLVITLSSIPFVQDAWLRNEASPSPGGLPARYLIKAVLPLGILAVGAAAIARILRVGGLLFGQAREQD